MEVARKIQNSDDVEMRRIIKEVKGEADTMPVLVDLSIKAYNILKERAERSNLRLEHYCSKILEETTQHE